MSSNWGMGSNIKLEGVWLAIIRFGLQFGQGNPTLTEFNHWPAGTSFQISNLSILGYYSKEKHEENKKIFDESDYKKPLKKKIEAFQMPYYELIMNDGTICDLNGQPRLTRVHYVCYPTGKNEIYSLKEASTCEYEVVVLTPLLCNHPDFRPEEASER